MLIKDYSTMDPTGAVSKPPAFLGCHATELGALLQICDGKG